MNTQSARKSKPVSTRISISVCLFPILFGNACTSTIQPSPAVSETVIESILPTAAQEQPWRLDSAWQDGGLGGAVFRASAIEHVVRQNDQKFVSVAFSTDQTADFITPESNGLDTIKISQIDDDPLLAERAWRKYCHHQLDMTPEEHTLIAHTQIPHRILSHGCNPGSLKK